MKPLLRILVFLMAVCGCSCAARTPDSRTAMISHEIRVGDAVYSFSVPPGESGDFPGQEVFDAFDLSSGDIPYRREGFTLMKKFWDYRNGRVGLNKDGTLAFQFRVRQFEHGFRFDKKNPQMLKNYLLDELSRTYGARNANHLSAGHDRLVVKIPIKIELVEFGKSMAFHYKLEGGTDFDAFVIPIAEGFFVQIQFNFIDNSVGRGMEWRRKAQVDADSIRSSMEIRPYGGS